MSSFSQTRLITYTFIFLYSKHIPFHPEGTSKEKVSFVNSFLANDSNEAWMMINIIDHCNLRWELSKSGKNLTIGKLLKKLIGPEMIQEFEWPSDRYDTVKIKASFSSCKKVFRSYSNLR